MVALIRDHRAAGRDAQLSVDRARVVTRGFELHLEGFDQFGCQVVVAQRLAKRHLWFAFIERLDQFDDFGRYRFLLDWR